MFSIGMARGVKLLLELAFNLRFDQLVPIGWLIQGLTNLMEFVAVELGFEVRELLNSFRDAEIQTKRMS